MIKNFKQKANGLAVVAALLLAHGLLLGGAATANDVGAVPISSIEKSGDYLPNNRVQPKYPRSAAEAGIGGYVVLELTVDKDGTVPAHSIKVVEAKPAGIFEKVAKDAAQQFAYQPMIVGGKATAVSGVRYKFSFNTEN